MRKTVELNDNVTSDVHLIAVIETSLHHMKYIFLFSRPYLMENNNRL